MKSLELTHVKESRKELFMEVDSIRKKLGFSMEEFCKLAEFPISLSTYAAWAYNGNIPNHLSALMLSHFLESDKPKQLEDISIEKRRAKEQRNKLNKFPNIKLRELYISLHQLQHIVFETIKKGDFQMEIVFSIFRISSS